MKGQDIRSLFLNYFKSKNHSVQLSSSLVPYEDPTILFTNAGMNQFKDCFLGSEKRDYTRATTSQKCMRISGKHNDFENVGVTARHHTFFEMLGNFSFGDYFKEEAISFAWELITKELKLSKERLWITIFENDAEAGVLWKKISGISESRILKMGEKDNFWAMGDTGPCGPCSEIHYYVGDDINSQSEENFRKEDGNYLEFWNLVFMQYNRSSDGKLDPLPKPSVDTGMGLERMSALLQGKAGNYETDLLRPIISKTEELSGLTYDDGSYQIKDLKQDKKYAENVAMRVIADHSRSIAFLLADGVLPSSDGRGYVLRRLIRRAIRHGKNLKFKDLFLPHTTQTVIDEFSSNYPELKEQKAKILSIVEAEERKFHETLDSGLTILNKEVEKLSSTEKFPGKTAFLLYDTYGFPLDLTEDALKAYGKSVDINAYSQEMELQKERSRAERKSQKITFVSHKIEGTETRFVGYNELEVESLLEEIILSDNKIEEEKIYSLIFKDTPFYAESGGQVGDIGQIIFKSSGITLEVVDTIKLQNKYFVHHCKLTQGELDQKLKGEKAFLQVNPRIRKLTSLNHSATHLLHLALRTVLGEHVKQAGSRVAANSFRFDYSHFNAPTESELSSIFQLVNHLITQNSEVIIQEMKIDEAKKLGAMALFGEKYGDIVRVVKIGEKSIELCGGTHAYFSGDIGLLNISSESAIASGVRRIECEVGEVAASTNWGKSLSLKELGNQLNTTPDKLREKIDILQSRTDLLEAELLKYKAKEYNQIAAELTDKNKTLTSQGYLSVVKKVEVSDIDSLKKLVDQVRSRLGSGVVLLGAKLLDSGVLVAGVTKDLEQKLNAGSLIKEVIKVTGGKGGGRADFAQAGGVPLEQLEKAFREFNRLLS